MGDIIFGVPLVQPKRQLNTDVMDQHPKEFKNKLTSKLPVTNLQAKEGYIFTSQLLTGRKEKNMDNVAIYTSHFISKMFNAA